MASRLNCGASGLDLLRRHPERHGTDVAARERWDTPNRGISELHTYYQHELEQGVPIRASLLCCNTSIQHIKRLEREVPVRQDVRRKRCDQHDVSHEVSWVDDRYHGA